MANELVFVFLFRLHIRICIIICLYHTVSVFNHMFSNQMPSNIFIVFTLLYKIFLEDYFEMIKIIKIKLISVTALPCKTMVSDMANKYFQHWNFYWLINLINICHSKSEIFFFFGFNMLLIKFAIEFIFFLDLQVVPQVVLITSLILYL